MTQQDALRGVIRWGTMPVPFVAAWSSETDVQIRADPVIDGRPAIFRVGRRGDGRPLFGAMSEERNRLVVVERLCQVCRRPIASGGFAIDEEKGRARNSPLIREPLTCEKCFRYSLAHCPGIAKMRGAIRLVAARVGSYDTYLIGVQYAEGHDADLNRALADYRGEPPIGYALVCPRDYEPIPFRDLIAMGLPSRDVAKLELTVDSSFGALSGNSLKRPAGSTP